MTSFIPIFPLNLVVFPGEELNLHIFEDQYKQLINDCLEEKKPFAIPAVLANKMTDLGTTVHIKEVSKKYEDGRMDIKTIAENPVRILEVIKEVPDKSYSGAIVSHRQVDYFGNKALMKKLVSAMRKFHKSLNAEKSFSKTDEELTSFDIAHHVGLSLEDEFYVLQMEKELQRQEFLKRHLSKMKGILEEMQLLKQKIELNGHFKNLSGFNL